MKHITMISLVIAFCTGAYAAPPTAGMNDYGHPVAGEAVGRAVEVTSSTKYIRVTNGETLIFKIGGKVFSWHISTYPGTYQFDLKQITPPDVTVHNVPVFVSPNPQYVGT